MKLQKIMRFLYKYYIINAFKILFLKKIGIECLRILKRIIYGRYKHNKLPSVLQLPITNKCNLFCKMCNVPAMQNLQDMNVNNFKKILNDKIFTQITSVGINGGEPFISPSLIDYVECLVALPHLKNINIISNGIVTKTILKKLEQIKIICLKQNIKVGVTFSFDGYGDIHDKIRGVDGAFKKTLTTLQSVMKCKEKYYDSLGIICTISKYNIFHLSELDCFFKINKLPEISYQLAVKHKRLNNETIIDDISIFNDIHATMLAKEFFFSKYQETKKDRYYYIYKYICDGFSNRQMSCPWQYDAITITATGELCYCATGSDSIGDIVNNNIYEQYFSDKNIKYKNNIIKNQCSSCIHYSDSRPYFRGYADLCSYNLKSAIWRYKYL